MHSTHTSARTDSIPHHTTPHPSTVQASTAHANYPALHHTRSLVWQHSGRGLHQSSAAREGGVYLGGMADGIEALWLGMEGR